MWFVGLLTLICSHIGCCMQDCQTSPLCSSPATADLSKDKPESCVLLITLEQDQPFAWNATLPRSVLVLLAWKLHACNPHFVFMTRGWVSFLRFLHTRLERIKQILPFLKFNLCSLLYILLLLYSICCFVFFLLFVCLLPFPSLSLLLQVFLPPSGSSQGGDQAWSPAASVVPHRALWYWSCCSASAAGSCSQVLL